MVNLDKLGYNRFKGYNYLGGNPVSQPSNILDESILESAFRDGIFESGKIENDLEVTVSDVVNYSGFELRVNIVMGLDAHLQDVVVIGNSLLPQSSMDPFPDTTLEIVDHELTLSTGGEKLLARAIDPSSEIDKYSSLLLTLFSTAMVDDRA